MTTGCKLCECIRFYRYADSLPYICKSCGHRKPDHHNMAREEFHERYTKEGIK